jgi:transposase
MSAASFAPFRHIINENGRVIRSLLSERGITIRQGRRHAEAALPGILEDPDTPLSGRLRTLLAQLQRELRRLQSQIEEIDEAIVRAAGEHEACQRLMTIPGVTER